MAKFIRVEKHVLNVDLIRQVVIDRDDPPVIRVQFTPEDWVKFEDAAATSFLERLDMIVAAMPKEDKTPSVVSGPVTVPRPRDPGRPGFLGR